MWFFEYVKNSCKILETLLALKVGISRENFISSRSNYFRVFSYIIWWTEYEKNHWGILDLETLQSRSNFIFCIIESWRWSSNVIDELKMGKTVKKNPQNIFEIELVIFKVKDVCGNFFTIFFILSAWNYIEMSSQTFMTNRTNFLHCTLRCLRGWSIYRPAVRSGTLPEIFSDIM